MKRLYIGGLGHTISEKDIRDRFGKFGEVSDVEIKTRKDEDGSSLKTFGYVNINISDSDYKRCVTVLNKSKWKGGTLQIELAKESFLHRLAEERQQVVEKIQAPRIDPQEKIVESFKAAGVENFHMKSAVPGTEIPGHKNWVVSKFGRVLPVLHLKCQGKNKVLKYDPSKHCHNIKKLESEETFTSVSKLTWQVDGGNDEISKKRRGEFPPQKKRPASNKHLDITEYLCSTSDGDKRTPACNREVNVGRNRRVCVLGSDSDSEDETRKLVAQERLRVSGPANAGDDDHLEVVDDEFVVKSGTFWGGDLGRSTRDEEYDSADTDEILTQNKNPNKAEDPKNVQKEKTTSIEPDPGTSLDSDPESESSDGSEDSDYEAMMGNCQTLTLSLADLQDLVKNLDEGSSDEEASETEAGPSKRAKSKPVSDARPAGAPLKKPGINPEDILASLLGSDDEKEEQEEERKPVKKSKLPAFVGSKDLFGSNSANLKRGAERIESGPKDESKRFKPDLKMLENGLEKSSASGGVEKSLRNTRIMEHSSSHETEMETSSIKPNKETNRSSEHQQTSSSASSSDDEDDEEPESVSSPSKTLKASESATSTEGSETSDEDEEESESVSSPSKTSTLPQKASSKSSAPESTTSSEGSETSDKDDEEDGPRAFQKNHGQNSERKPVQCPSDPLRQRQDNQKRLAALEQRQKEAEQQKKLIQGALSKVDLPNVNKGKHIVFESDDDDDSVCEAQADQKQSLFDEECDDDDDDDGVENPALKEKEFHKAAGSKLFDSSEDEDEEDEGAEEDRFEIKPQFEGKAGQKLMELQSRFGTDPRFQMDAKFLEHDSDGREEDGESDQIAGEQELVEEKKKNLAILQSLLNVSVQPSDPSKASMKAKTFRDVSALHYDPTSEAHAAFETRTEEPKKESKAARRKKREEAQKLPEVSKEIFYDVTTDLKEVFGTGTEIPPEQENTEVSWDQADENVNGLSSSADVEPEGSSSGFKFSFFGDDATAETPKTDEYKAETLKGAKVPWQVDPRFQDSSSDEEEDEEEEEEEMEQSAVVTAPEAPTQTRLFFFFFDGDIRLKEGPGMFCRSEKLEDQRKAWEERRAGLREDCRKKHKDAKRRYKMTMKT
ncbi:nucleolar protein 8 [Trichomycterus rosablanca]|uniref:nucleolar protein 8 n=1 Tax=Trichomycterus rosablanca TaxID=2290929 RepID=UPI002F357B39